jgi:uncharacterized cupredoxin-like copper-binding protein
VKKAVVGAAAAIAAAAAMLFGLHAADAAGNHAGGVRTVDVTIHYSHFSVSHLSFPAGTTVRFVIRNTDPIDHEFILGTRGVQELMEHTKERVHTGAIPGQISIPAETTRTTTFTFGAPGNDLLFGCHLPGHYRYGMRGSITVTA